jgi:outer membrane receptor for ferrienterochelin and colicin
MWMPISTDLLSSSYATAKFGVRNLKGHGKVKYIFSDKSDILLDIGAGHFDIDLYLSPGILGNVSRTSMKGWSSDIRLQYRYDDFLATFYLMAADVDITDISGRMNTYDWELQHSFNFWKDRNIFLYGLNVHISSMTAQNYTDSGYNHTGYGSFFIQNETHIVPQKLRFILGGRYDHMAHTGDYLSPQMVLVGQASENHTFRLGYSRAIRIPNFTDKLANQIIPLPLNSTLYLISLKGYKNLKAPKIDEIDIGWQAKLLQQKLNPFINVFYFQATDMIIMDSLSFANYSFSNFANSNESVTGYGSEAGFDWIIMDELKLFANFSFLQQKQDSGDIKSSPQYTINTGGYFKHKSGINSYLGLSYVGDIEIISQAPAIQGLSFVNLETPDKVNGYAYINFKLGYQFFKNKAEIAFVAQNALNNKHRQWYSSDILEGIYMGKFSYKFF